MAASISARIAAGCVSAWLAVGSAGAWQTSATAVDLQRIGPQVGTVVPDFTLADQSGTERSLDSLMGRDGVVLIFFRSADW